MEKEGMIEYKGNAEEAFYIFLKWILAVFFILTAIGLIWIVYDGSPIQGWE